ncbi:MAG: ABC transporter permease subunit, partial [Burkholderiales bacterium]|nr:ABC transporter permease subunit [Phycisphaerae bacterium]
ATMGHVFFAVFTLFSIAAMHLIGPVLTSTAIGSERLNRTLDVLLMTPISSWQLVTGKLFSRLFTALVLIGLSLPVLAIVRLLGGVELEDMFGALALAACVALSSAAMGLLLSCWMKRAWAVILMCYLLQAAIYCILPLTIAVLIANSGGSSSRSMWGWITVFTASNPLFTAATRTMPGSGMFGGWWEACYVQIGFAACLTMLSAVIVRRIGRKQAGGRGVTTDAPPTPAPHHLVPADLAPADLAVPPPLPSEPYLSTRSNATSKPISSRAVSNSPILWRELRQPLFPKLWQRVVAVIAVLGNLIFSYFAFGFDRSGVGDEDVHIGYAFILHTLLTLIAVVLSSTAIATEKESDTWTLLIVTPVSGGSVVLGKFFGVFRRLFWPWLLVVFHFLFFTVYGVLSIWSALVVIWVALTFNIVWIATGLYLSLRLRRVTSAVVTNLLLVLTVYAAIPILIAVASPRRLWEEYDPSELCYYWLPYWYLGFGIDEISSGSRSVLDHGNTFNVPVVIQQWPIVYFIHFALISGLVQVLISWAILWFASTRFDKIVGRARG